VPTSRTNPFRTVGKDAKGKPVKVEMWGATQAEVVRKLATAGPPGPETTVGDHAERWLVSIDVRPATLGSRQKNVRLHIVPAIGPVKVKDLTIGRVESFGVGLVKGGLQPITVRLALTQLRTMLSAAVRDGLIPTNPVQTARKPRGEVKKLAPYPMADLVRIIAHAPTYSAGEAVSLLAACGCRAGEAMALDVADFDEAKGAIAITKTWDRVRGLGRRSPATAFGRLAFRPASSRSSEQRWATGSRVRYSPVVQASG
jgi:integrase